MIEFEEEEYGESQSQDMPLFGGKITPVVEKAITDKILELKQSSEQFYQGRRARWLDYFYHYINKKRERTRTTIPSPLASEHVDILTADTMAKIHSVSPVATVKGRNITDKQSAPAIEKLIQYQLDKMDFDEISYSVIKSTFIYGSCPFRVVMDEDWDEVPMQDGEVKLLQYIGPKILVYDIFDYFPCGAKVTPNDPAPSIVRMYRPFEYIEEKADLNPGLYFNIGKIPHKRHVNLQNDDLNARQERQHVMGMSPEATERGLVEILECDMWWPVRRKDNYYVYKPCIFTLVNGTLVRASRNNYISQHGNMGIAVADRVPNDLFGIGLIEKMHPNVHGANTVLDMILTNLELSVDKQKVISKDQVINLDQAQRNFAGNTIVAKGDARTAMKWEDGGSIVPDAYAMLSHFYSASESASGVQPIKKGSLQKGVTATSDMLAHQESSSRFNLFGMMISKTFIKPSMKMMQKVSQQFMPLPVIVPILDEYAESYPVVDYQAIAGDYDFVPEGWMREANKQMEVAQIENFLSIVASVPALYPVIPMIVGKLAREFRWDEAKQIEQLAAMAIQQFMMMQQLLNAQSAQEGSGGNPSGGGGGRINQKSGSDNMAGMKATNITDLNQSLLGSAGVSAFS